MKNFGIALMQYYGNGEMDYKYLFKALGNGDEAICKKRISQRFSFFCQVAKNFISEKGLSEYVIYSKDSIKEVCLNYFSDIVRLKDFHNIEITNPQKVGAYSTYWIYKCKPMQLIKDIDKEIFKTSGTYSKNIHAHFCVEVLISMVFDMTDAPKVEGADVKHRWTDLIDVLYYYFIYRIVTPQSLELMLQALITEPRYKLIVK